MSDTIPADANADYLKKIKAAMMEVRNCEWRISSVKFDMKEEKMNLARCEGTLRGIIAESIGLATPSLFPDAKPKAEAATAAEAEPTVVPELDHGPATAKIVNRTSGWWDLLIDEELDQSRNVISKLETAGITTLGELADSLGKGVTFGLDTGILLQLKEGVESARSGDDTPDVMPLIQPVQDEPKAVVPKTKSEPASTKKNKPPKRTKTKA